MEICAGGGDQFHSRRTDERRNRPVRAVHDHPGAPGDASHRRVPDHDGGLRSAAAGREFEIFPNRSICLGSLAGARLRRRRRCADRGLHRQEPSADLPTLAIAYAAFAMLRSAAQGKPQ